jgi:hypothetical protein
METIRFDDIEKLKSKISPEYSGWSQTIEVTQDKINQLVAEAEQRAQEFN